jgi:hypothetical protein
VQKRDVVIPDKARESFLNVCGGIPLLLLQGKRHKNRGKCQTCVGLLLTSHKISHMLTPKVHDAKNK